MFCNQNSKEKGEETQQKSSEKKSVVESISIKSKSNRATYKLTNSQRNTKIKSSRINKRQVASKSVHSSALFILQLFSLLNFNQIINHQHESSIVFANGAKTRHMPSGATCSLPTIKSKLSVFVDSSIDIEEHLDLSTSPELAAIKMVKPAKHSIFYTELIQASQNTLLFRNQLDKSPVPKRQQQQQQLRRRRLKRQFNPVNQTIQIGDDPRNSNIPPIPAIHQIAFESICNGWRNSIEPNSLRPAAYWAFDEYRGALVAKFIYYNKQEFLDISLREARLTSPIFHPIPAYHSMQDSKYYLSCKVSFKAYITITAYLELTLIVVPTTASGASQVNHQQQIEKQQQDYSNGTTIQTTTQISRDDIQNTRQQQQQHQQSRPVQHTYQLAKLVGGKTPIGKQLAEKAGELAAWTYQEIELPHDLGENSLYILEFSAMSGTVSSAALQQHNYLNGVAIANFSLSPQCFGLNVDESELKRVKFITGKDPAEFDEQLLAKINSHESHTSGHNYNSQYNSTHRLVINFFETYKMAIFIIVIVILIMFIFSSQYLLCVYHQSQLKRNNSNGNNNKKKNNNNNNNKTILPLSIIDRLCCCCCYLCCYDIYKRHTNRNRVYASKQSDAQEDKLREEERNLRNYLRPIQNVFENVELNENPNYVANGATCLSKEAIIQLKPYFIDRRRLMQTKMLGNGAFGAVYQGFLLCYGNDTNTDNINIINNRFHQTIEFDHLDSHSKKVAVKTLTEKRMSPADFITEAINMSLVTPHRNIVELIGVCFDEQPLYIVMELLEGGNLKDFLIANRDKSSVIGTQNQSYNDVHSTGMSPFNQQDDCDTHSYSNDDYVQGNPVYDGTNLLWRSNNNLNHYQQQPQQPEDRIKLCMGDLLVFASDIARACDYLQKKRFIHRDLAARNCLLTSIMKRLPNDRSEQQLYVQESSITQQQHHSSVQQNQRNSTVSGKSFFSSLHSALDVDANYKVDLEQVFLDGYMNSGMVANLADFGMTRDVKAKEYYSVKHKEMPVRWMPPEYVVDGVATTKSDVWSFGVFLWELFSMGQQPYQELADNQDVIKFIKSRRFAEPKMMAQSIPKTETELVTILDESNPTIVLHKNLTLNQDQNQNDGDFDDNNNDEEALEDENDAFYARHQHQSMVTNESDAPLPYPHHNTPQTIYSIMCSCWATEPKKRPDFEEIANRLYWCLQKTEVLDTSLPLFYESHLNTSPSNMASGQNIRSESRQSGANNTQTTQLNWQ